MHEPMYRNQHLQQIARISAGARWLLALMTYSPLTLVTGCDDDDDDDGNDTSDVTVDSDSGVVDTSDPCGDPVDCLPDFSELASFGPNAQLVFSANAAYIADPDVGAIFEVPFPDGPARKVVDAPVVGSLGPQTSLATIAVGSGRLFYNTLETVVIDTQVVERRQLRSFTLPDGPETVLTDVDGSWGIAVHGAEIFYRDQSVGYYRNGVGWMRRPSDGTGAAAPFAVLSTTLQFDDVGNVFFDQYNSDSPWSIAVGRAPVGPPPSDSTPPDPPEVTVLTQGFQAMTDLRIESGRAFFCDSTLFTVGTSAPDVATEMLLGGRPYPCGGYAVLNGSLFARTPMSNGVKVMTMYDSETGATVGPIASPASSGEARFAVPMGLFAVESASLQHLMRLPLP